MHSKLDTAIALINCLMLACSAACSIKVEYLLQYLLLQPMPIDQFFFKMSNNSIIIIVRLKTGNCIDIPIRKIFSYCVDDN